MNRKFLDVLPIFIYGMDRTNNVNISDEMTFMLPITEEEEIKIRAAIACDESVTLNNGLQIDYKSGAKRVRMFGKTDSIPRDAAENIGVYYIWYNVLKDTKTRECVINDNGYLSIYQIYDAVSLVKLGITMLGNPERIVVAKIKVDVYKDSSFYKQVIKPITHGKN